MTQTQLKRATDIREEAVKLIRSIEGKNTYSQNATKREKVFETPGYGDCSSTVRLVLQKAGLNYSIGSNTNAQMKNRQQLGIISDVSNTGYPDVNNLLPGDCLYFRGNKAHTLNVGHVEMYIGDGYCMGHGSGKGPKLHRVKDYCKSRIAKTTRYFMAIRWAFDFGERTLSQGCYGADVRMLQQSLIDTGCTLLGECGDEGNGIDGDFGALTNRAVCWYQNKIGITEDGIANKELIARLIAESTEENEETGDDEEADRNYSLGDRDIIEGMVGKDVAELQEGLKSLGYNLGNTGESGDGIDGEYGILTMSAVISLCAAHNVQNEDGIFDADAYTIFVNALNALDAIGKNTEKYPVLGYIPDISVYQGNITYSEFCAKNDFCIARARINGKTDSLIEKHMQAFSNYRFPFSVYDYVMLKSEADARIQAEAFYTLCSPHNPRVWYLDVEKRATGVTRAQLLNYLGVYITRLRELGAEKVGLYTGDYNWRTWLYKIADKVDDVWIAAYGGNTGYLSKMPTNIVGGLHQYTSAGGTKCAGAPGVNHRVDLNRLTGQKPLSWYTGYEYENPEYFGVIQVTGDTVNVRADASTSSARIALATKNMLYARREGDKDGWIAIWYENVPAYISAKFVALITG